MFKDHNPLHIQQVLRRRYVVRRSGVLTKYISNSATQTTINGLIP